jgi:hypothetical protein
MKPIIILMLCLDAAIVLVSIFIVAIRKRTVAPQSSLWSSLATILVIAAVASSVISKGHTGTAGADVLGSLAAVLVGMAVMAAMLVFRDRKERSQRPL